MKVNYFVKAITLMMCVILVLPSIPVHAIETRIGDRLYSANVAYGKIFIDGVNTPVRTKNQFDTQITNVNISSKDENYYLSFIFESSYIEISGKLISAKANNVNGDHYILSPSSFANATFSCVQISFTTAANDYDLMPANSNLIGKPVISIIFENINTSDVYYWQSELTSLTRTIHSFKTSTDESVVDNANEFYYINKSTSVNSCSSADFEGKEMATYEQYQASKSTDIMQSTRSTIHNPYYDDGIPDSVFTTATETWRWLAPGINSYGTYYHFMYYAYSYTKYGNPNIMTHIMIVDHVWQLTNSETAEVYTAEDGNQYAKTNAILQISLWERPQTIIYYTDTNTFGFMEGGEMLTRIVEPSVEIKKNSNNIPHVLVGRSEFSNATPKGLWGMGNLVLKEVVIGVLDTMSFGFASVAVDIGEIISGASNSVTTIVSSTPKEPYYPSNYIDQLGKYDYVLGGIKSCIKGYLEDNDQYFGLKAWFATPIAYRDNVDDITWVYYVSADYS